MIIRKIILASAFPLIIVLSGCSGATENEVPKAVQETILAIENKVLKRRKLFDEAVEYYTGSKGIPQNYKKAEELFKQSAEENNVFAPAYISALLAYKHDKLPQFEKPAIAWECYFWTLIALAYSSTTESYLEGGGWVFSSLESKKRSLENNLALHEIEQIQNQATNWCEAHYFSRSGIELGYTLL